MTSPAQILEIVGVISINKKHRVSTVIVVLTVFSMVAVTPIQAQEVFTIVSITLFSSFAPIAPKIDGIVSTGEWDNTAKIQLSHGWLLIQNDVSALYVLIDLTGDTGDDPSQETEYADGFWLTFDVDLDGEISGTDINYAPYPSTYTLGMQYYIGSGEMGELGPTTSQLGVGFGVSINSRESHRIFELAISLPEIRTGRAELANSVRLGLRTFSGNPRFTMDEPEAFFLNFVNLREFVLTLPPVDLLILTDEAFYEALKPLKAHKEYTGISTYIQSWQSLNQSFGSKGRDIPERIKKGIAAYVQSCGTKYVMLVGDIDRFPVRYIKAYNTEWGNKFYPSDLYYADLYDATGSFDDWDYDNDGLFGEMDFAGGKIDNNVNLDRINLYPDVQVGRIPASTVVEVMIYVNKVISYEYAAYQSDWFKKALFIVDGDPNPFGSPTKKDQLVKTLPGFTIFKLYQDNPPYDAYSIDQRAAEINTRLNSGVGFVNFFAHGNTRLWDRFYDPDRMVGVFTPKKWHDYFSIDGEIPSVGDFNGDGLDDVITFIRDTKTEPGAGDVYVTLSMGSSFGTASKWHESFSLGTSEPRIGDFNGDGCDDIISFERGTSGDVYVSLSMGSSFGAASKWHEMFSIGNEWPAVGDFNGDGKDDIITFIRSTKGGAGAGDVVVSLSNGSGFGPAASIWHNMFCIGQEHPAVGDFNGDGKDDIVTFIRSTKGGAGAGDVYVALSTGSSFGSAAKWHGYFGIGNEWPAVGDFNGDDKSDIIVFIRNTKGPPGEGDVWVSLSTGSSFGLSKMMNGDFCSNGEWADVGDFTGDGLTDIVSFVRDVKAGGEQADVNVAKMVLLNNSKKLPVIFAVSCYTGRFHFNRDFYQDVKKNEWTGGSTTKPNRPEPMAVQPAKYDRDAMAEEFLVKSSSGAVAYIGATSVYEYGGENLDQYFFEAYQAAGKSLSPTLGYLWDQARKRFITNHLVGQGMGGYYAYPHIHKVMLFGDPSLRVGGVPPRIDVGIIPPGVVHIPPELIGTITLVDTPPEPIVTTIDHKHLKPVTTTQQVVVTTTFEPSESTIEIFEIRRYAHEGRLDVVIIRGAATGVRLIEVTLLVAGEQLFVAEVNPDTGEWEAIFEGVQVEAGNGQPIAVVACALDSPQENCVVLELRELPFFTPPPEAECRIENVEVLLEGPQPPQVEIVERVIVIGTASGCELLEVVIVCGRELSTVVEVDPIGRWEAIFEGIQADCVYGRSIEVYVCSLEPPSDECVTVHLDLVPIGEPSETSEPHEIPRSETETSPVPGFGFVEFLIVILAILGYKKRRIK